MVLSASLHLLNWQSQACYTTPAVVQVPAFCIHFAQTQALSSEGASALELQHLPSCSHGCFHLGAGNNDHEFWGPADQVADAIAQVLLALLL